jgi:hypothetical protein
MFNEQNEIEDAEEGCTDCGALMGHYTRHADGRELCDDCEDHFQEQS